MRVYHNIDDIDIKSPIVTIGIFDGVHLGHNAILNKVLQESGKTGNESMVLTFWPHPRKILQPETDLQLLNVLEEKIGNISSKGIQNLVIIPFSHAFSRITSREFIEKILVNKLSIKQLIIGYNHHFGRDREGNPGKIRAYANEFGFKFDRVEAKIIEGEKVSSSKIRNYLFTGNLQKANHFLGYPYFLSGKVVGGSKIGSTIGFPTANILPYGEDKLIPKDGVYAVEIKIKEKVHKGMLNIGIRPTLNSNSKRRIIEVNIFGLNEDLYEKELTVIFHHRMRDEMKFKDLGELTSQLKKDKAMADKLLSCN